MVEATGDESGRGGARWRRLIPLVVLLAILAAVVTSGAGQKLVDVFVTYRRTIGDFVEAHTALALVGYVLFYAAIVAISLPGAAIVTVSGGFLFGWLAGGAAAVVGATLGAIAVFLAARTAFGDVMARRAGPRLTRFLAGFQRDAAWYLLFLRLVPAFPFFLVNLAAALAGVRLKLFAWTTLVGIVPATFVFAFAGSGLDGVLAARSAEFEACRAAAAANCRLSLSVHDFVTWKVLLAFAALGMLSLLPILLARLPGGARFGIGRG